MSRPKVRSTWESGWMPPVLSETLAAVTVRLLRVRDDLTAQQTPPFSS